MKIKIKTIGVDKKTEESLNSGYLYKDIALDLENSRSFNNQLNRTEILKDVSAIYDVQAVKNSIATAFLTSPGDNLLDPTYGVDLRQYLFEPIDDFTSDIIKDDILSKLPKMEPRVKITSVVVEGVEDENQFNVFMKIDIPSLDVYGISVKYNLTSSGYSIL